jgi:hypothetical protein
MGPKQGTGSKTPAAKMKRKPIYDKLLGRIDEVPRAAPIDHPPKVQKFGLCPKPTDAVKKPIDGASMMVRSNYVRVTKVPTDVYVYSLDFSCPSKDGSGRIRYDRRREIRGAFETLVKQDALQLKADNMKWVTDFKSLWTSTPINGCADSGYTFQSEAFEYIQPNGKKISQLSAKVCLITRLADIDKSLHTKHLKDLLEYIRALNASVAQCVEQHQHTTKRPVNRVSANKFYISNGYVNMEGLRAGRGYYTSIRPGSEGTPLNVNPATSAFLPPTTVSDFIRKLGTNKQALSYIGQLMQGATLKILYRRSNYENSDIDYNSEAARLKIFTQFGCYNAKKQKFYELTDKEEDKPRKAKASDNGTTVYNYFTNSECSPRICDKS